MKNILYDAIRRWWWVVALSAAGSAFLVGDGGASMTPLTLTSALLLYGPVMLFVFEVGGPVKFRAFSAFPVRRRDIGLAFGLVWVFLVPAVHTLLWSAALLARAAAPDWVPAGLPPATFFPLLVYCAGASCALVQISLVSSRLRPGWAKSVTDGAAMFGVYATYIVTGYFLYRLGLATNAEPLPPGNPFAATVAGIESVIGPKQHAVDPPGLTTLAVAGLIVAQFFLRADRCGECLLALGSPRAVHPGPERPAAAGTLMPGGEGPWFQAIQGGLRFVGVVTFSVLSLYVFLWMVFGKPSFKLLEGAEWAPVFIVAAGLLCVPPMAPWIAALRTLRALPFSPERLVCYLLSFPLLAFAAASALLFCGCMWLQGLDYAAGMQCWAVLAFGVALLFAGPVLASRSTIVTLFCLFFPTILTAVAAMALGDPVGIMIQTPLWIRAAVGLVLFAAGFAGLRAALACGGAYRPKPWLGGTPQ